MKNQRTISKELSKEWQQISKQMDWVIRHRFKIWGFFAVCITLSIWVLLK